MTRRKQPGRRLPAPAAPEPADVPDPEDEVGHLLCVLRDQLRRANVFVTTAEEKVELSWGRADGDLEEVMFRRHQVEDLVEAAKLEVRAANYTGAQLAAEIAAQRRRA